MARKRTTLGKTASRADIKTVETPDRPLTIGRPELLVGGSDRDFRRLVNSLFPLLTLHSDIRNGYAEQLGLNGASYSILLCIRTLGDSGPVNIRTIVEQLRLSGSFITAETNALERKGLVTKRRGQHDKRLVSVSLTAKAVVLLDSIATLRQQVNDVQFGSLSREEFQVLVPAIERLVLSSERALALLSFLKSNDDVALASPAGKGRKLRSAR